MFCQFVTPMVILRAQMAVQWRREPPMAVNCAETAQKMGKISAHITVSDMC